MGRVRPCTLILDFWPQNWERISLSLLAPPCVVTCYGHHRTLIQRLDDALCPTTTSEPLSGQTEARGPRAAVQRPGTRRETAQELGRHEGSSGTCLWRTFPGLGLNGPRPGLYAFLGVNWHCLFKV